MEANTEPLFLPQSPGLHTCTADIIIPPLDFEIQYRNNPEQRPGGIKGTEVNLLALEKLIIVLC